MSVSKMIEVSAESVESFDDAMKEGLKRTAKSVDNITSALIEKQYVAVEDGRIKNYHVEMKVEFVVKG